MDTKGPKTSPITSCDPQNPKTLCSGKPKFSVKAFGASFAVCDVTTDFSKVAPDARPYLTPAMVLATPSVPASEIEFTSQPTANKFTWEITAIQDACLPTALDPSDFMIGFVQTVEALKFEASYTNGWTMMRAVPSRAKDANPTTIPDPWFNPAGALSGPVGVDSGTAPVLADKMYARFPIALPTPKMDPKASPCAFITGIELTGSFTIWLVIQQVSTGMLAFLCNANATVSQEATRPLSMDPAQAMSWTGKLGSGPFAISSFAAGMGATSPKLGTPAANDLIALALPFPGSPCPVKP